MREDSMFLMLEGESSDESDDSNDAEDGTDLDCNNHKINAVQNQLPAVIKALVVSIYIDKIDMMILLTNLSFEIIQNYSAHVQVQGLIQVLQQGLIQVLDQGVRRGHALMLIHLL